MIVITEFMDQSAVAMLSQRYETVYQPDLADRQHDIAVLLGSVRALIVRNRTQVNSNLLESAPVLSCIGRLGVGLDNIDTTLCRQRNIAVFPARGANDQSVCEYVLTSAMMLLRASYQMNEQMLAGAWPRLASIGCEIAGKKIGLVGFGAIAQLIAQKANLLGMKVCAYDPYSTSENWQNVENLSLTDLLSDSDIISMHVPLTDETKHMINADALRYMKKSAVLINAARGGVVDENALAEALAKKQLAGAALDVFEHEPLTATNAQKFAGIANLYLTPHIAGITYQSNSRVSMMTANQVANHLEKKYGR